MIRAAYDRHQDVLYVSLGHPRPDYGEESDGGILWRFAEADDAPCGVTVFGFREGWAGQEVRLARKIGVFLRADANEVVDAITTAVSRETAV